MEKFLTAPLVGRRQGDHPERRRRRRHARLARGARREDRQRTLALLRRPQGRRRWQRNVEGRSQLVEDRRGRHLADRFLRSRDEALYRRYWQPVSDLRPAVPPGRQPLHELGDRASNVDTGKLAWHFQYTPNDSWDFDEVGVHMLYDVLIGGQMRKVVGHYGETASITRSIARPESSSAPRNT